MTEFIRVLVVKADGAPIVPFNQYRQGKRGQARIDAAALRRFGVGCYGCSWQCMRRKR